MYDPNQNKYYKINGNIIANNGNNITNGAAIVRERYQQHPALMAIINDTQGMKFRGNYMANNYFIRT